MKQNKAALLFANVPRLYMRIMYIMSNNKRPRQSRNCLDTRIFQNPPLLPANPVCYKRPTAAITFGSASEQKRVCVTHSWRCRGWLGAIAIEPAWLHMPLPALRVNCPSNFHSS